MSAVAAAVICGMLVGASALLIVRELTTSHPHLESALTTITSGDPLRVNSARTEGAPQGRERVGAWLETRQAQIPFLRIPRVDLDLLGMTPRTFLTQKATCAAVGVLIPLVLKVGTALLGLPLPFVVSLGGSLVLALVFWFLPDADVANRAAASRQEFAFAAIAYLRLVAIQRLGSAGVVTSLEDSSRLSDAWMFQRIRESLTSARYAGVTSWDALERLGESLSVPELQEIADITRLSESGAAINTNLMARAASMRDRLLSAEHIQASRAVTSMAAPTAVLLGLFTLTFLIPAAIKIIGS